MTGWRRTLPVALAWLAGCAARQPQPQRPPPPRTLDDGQPAPRRPATGRLTLIVAAVQAEAGFDSARLLYQREPHRLEPYAYSAWVDTPARLLMPRLLQALVDGGPIAAALPARAGAAGDLRVDVTLVRLQQGFDTTPSHTRLTLRAVLQDEATRRVIAVREIDESAPAPTEDAAGGVQAAHAAVRAALRSLSAFANAAASVRQQTDGGGAATQTAP